MVSTDPRMASPGGLPTFAGCFADAKDAPIPDPPTNGQWSYSTTRAQPSVAEWNRAGRRMMGDKRTATNLAISGARLTIGRGKGLVTFISRILTLYLKSL
jgi:hypothetical protein